MIEQIWSKKLTVIIQMHPQDIADDDKPLPLITQFSWNAYIGFYYTMIREYFQAYAPFPYNKEQFYLTLQNSDEPIPNCQIVYHISQKYNLKLDQPLHFICHFRRQTQTQTQTQQQIDLRRHFKNNLKSSTALRYGKYGASILTIQMSISNVQNMINSFQSNNYSRFMGVSNFQDQNLGYRFLIHRGEKVPLRMIYGRVVVQRAVQKNMVLKNFMENTFGEELASKLKLRLHFVPLENLQIKMSILQKYCHPDGYLYIHIDNQLQK